MQPETEAKFEKPKKNGDDGSNPRATGIAALFAVIFIALFGAGAAFFVFLGAALSNGVILTGLTGAYSVAEIIHQEWHTYAYIPIVTNDLDAQDEFIRFINPIETGYNSALTFSQVGISLWDYSVPIVVYLIQIAFDVLMPIFKYVIAALFPYLMELLLMCVELLQIFMYAVVEVFQALAVSLSGSEFEQDAVNTSGGGSAGPVGGDVGAVPGGTVGGQPLNFINSFRKVSRFYLRIWQVIFFAVATILRALDVSFLTFINWLFNIFVKYMPLIMKSVVYLVNLLDPSSPLGKLIFTGFDLQFRLFQVIYGQCQVQEAILKTLCGIVSILNSIFKKIEHAAHINLPSFPNCNINTIGSHCHKPPPNPFKDMGFFGVGICDATVCAEQVVNIIDLLSVQLPTCNQWVANANSTLACMSVTYNYSVTQSTYTGNTPIDAIAKELCFVLTVLVNNQCAQSLPPFSFDYGDAANSICVADRSGLVPPAAPFNDQCACVFTAPLCDAGCCNQYARHVNGQILYYIGGYTCGQALLQFPDTFWCQFSTTTALNITPSSDYTFSSTWCQAYRSIIYPSCSVASPLTTLAALDTPALVDAFSVTACNQTVNQVGVCKRINTTTSADFVDFQYSLGSVSLAEVYAGMPPLGSTSFITIPTASTPIDAIALLDIQKYYCYAFFQQYNITNPAITSTPNSPLAAIFSYCSDSIGEQLGNFDLDNYTYYKLITSTGEPKPIDLASIPVGVSPFAGTFGGGAPIPPEISPDCPSDMTGYNPQELSYQQECGGQQQQVAVNTGVVVGETGVEANEALTQNAATIAPAAHLSGVTPVNSSSPNATAYTIEADQLTAASDLSTNWQITPSSQTSSITSNFRTNYPSPTADAATPFYVQYKNNPAGRNTLSIEEVRPPPKKLHNEAIDRDAKAMMALAILAKIKTFFDGELEKLMQRLEKIEVDDPFSAKTVKVVGPESARRGKAKLLRVMSVIEEENQDKSSRFMRTRRLLATGNPTVDYYVESFWDNVANANVEDAGISDYSLDNFLSDEALKDVRVLYSHTMEVWSVNIYNYLYDNNVTIQDIDEMGLDYSYSGGLGGTPVGSTGRCKNSLQKPLQCCKANTSPYGCCYGIPLVCIPMVPNYFYAPVTTRENMYNWKCDHFFGFLQAWIGTTKTIVTAVVNISLQLSPGDFSGIAKVTLGWVTYPNFEIPPYSIQCMFVNLNYLLLGILLIWIIMLIVTLPFFAEIIAILLVAQNNVQSEWRGKGKG